MEQLGTFLGRYQLVRVLGRGAMGVVYEGVDPKLNRQVAVKTILKSQLIDQQVAEEYAARFIREAQAVARLNHPNIVTVFDFGNEADVAYLVMEFIRGKELKNYLDDKHVFGITEAVTIVCDLLEALDYAHNNGVIHRDIKPANVMLDGNGRVKLTDFGVARLIDGGAHEGTRVGTMVGTPSYMSPEQIKGLPVGAQADLFATGVLLYQCLSLQKPFVGSSEWDIWQKIVNQDPPALSTYRAAVPVALERAMLSALAKDPKNRPATARALIIDLKAAIAGQEFDADATRLVSAWQPQSGRDDVGSMARSKGWAQGQTQAQAQNQAQTQTQTQIQGGSQADMQRQLQQASEVELEFWRSIKDSTDHQEFQLYLERFSNGTYADLARRKMSKLRALDGTQRTQGTSQAYVAAAAQAAVEAQELAATEAQAQAQAEAQAAAAAQRQVLENEQRKATAHSHQQAEKIAEEKQSEKAAGEMPAQRQAIPAVGSARSKAPLFAGGAAVIAVLIGGAVMMRGTSPSTPPPASAQASAGPAPAIPAIPVAPAVPVASVVASAAPVVTMAPKSDAAAQSAGEAKKRADAAQDDLARAAQKAMQANAVRADQQERDRASELAAKKASDDARSKDGAAQKAREEAKVQELASAKAAAAQKAGDDAKAQELASAAAKASDEAKAKAKPKAEVDPQVVFEQAQRAEKEGRVREAVALYKQAYGAGNGRAARMLGDIYARGSGDVGRDYSEQVQWYGKAKAMGVDVPVLNKRNF